MDQDCPICKGEGWRCEEQSCRTNKLASSAEIRIACPRYQNYERPLRRLCSKAASMRPCSL